MKPMSTLFVFLICLCCSDLSAQSAIRQLVLPRVGDTMYIAVDAIPGRLDLRSGANRRWDYSSLQGLPREQLLLPAAVGDYAGAFPSADLLLINSGRGEVYYKKKGEVFELKGFAGLLSRQLGLKTLVSFQPAIVERRSILDYRDSYAQEAKTFLAFRRSDLPASLQSELPMEVDSLRLKISIQRESDVDAWGKLRIPEDEYDVLRERITEERTLELAAKWKNDPTVEWRSLSDEQARRLTVQFEKLLGPSKTECYRYVSDEAIEPIAAVYVEPQTNNVLSVEFKSSAVAVNRLRFADNGKTNIFAYPNPAIDEIRFDMVNLKQETYQLKIFNILGMEVASQTYPGDAPQKTVKLNLSKLRKGTYLCSLVNERGKTITTKRLLIIRP